MCPPSGQYEHNMNITVTDGDCYNVYKKSTDKNTVKVPDR